MQIKNFILSLISPIRMFKYRNMSILIGILIFLGAANLISIPYNNLAVQSAARWRDEYNILAITEIPDTVANNQVISEIKNYECKVADRQVVCENLNEGDLIEKTINYVQAGITKNIHIFMDYSDIPQIILSQGFKLEDYPYVANEEHFFIVITPHYLYFQAHQVGINDITANNEPVKIIHNNEEIKFDNGVVYFTHFRGFDISDIDNANDFGNYVADVIVLIAAETAKSTATMMAMLIVFLFPFIIVLLFFIILKRSGHIKTYKEFYNIAAITVIIPTLVTFALAWSLPQIIDFFIPAFAIYYLIILFKINNNPQLI